MALLLTLWLAAVQANANESPLIAVASSLRQVWPALMHEYRELDAATPRVTFGSSGNLARQILQGAPFDLFLSADDTYPQWLIENGVTDHTPVTYAYGLLAWVTQPDSTLAVWLNTTEKTPDALPAQLTRLSIANPAFAPYGIAAKEILDAYPESANLAFTLGENAVQALQFALSGASDGGIVPLSLVSNAARAQLPPLQFKRIDPTRHNPLVHTMILLTEKSGGEKALFDFLLSETAQRILAQNGFEATR